MQDHCAKYVKNYSFSGELIIKNSHVKGAEKKARTVDN